MCVGAHSAFVSGWALSGPAGFAFESIWKFSRNNGKSLTPPLVGGGKAIVSLDG